MSMECTYNINITEALKLKNRDSVIETLEFHLPIVYKSAVKNCNYSNFNEGIKKIFNLIKELDPDLLYILITNNNKIIRRISKLYIAPEFFGCS